MNVLPTSLPGVVLLEPKIYTDARGFFFESYSERTFAALHLPTRYVQDNHSKSVRGVLRGIHYQLRKPQGKLVRVVQGEVFDVAVDLRRSSLTFGRSVGEILSESNRRMLWIPPGFGHAFLVLSQTAEFVYKASELYEPELERTLLWSDPALGIDWPLEHLGGAGPIVSAKDAVGLTLGAAELYE